MCVSPLAQIGDLVLHRDAYRQQVPRRTALSGYGIRVEPFTARDQQIKFVLVMLHRPQERTFVALFAFLLLFMDESDVEPPNLLGALAINAIDWPRQLHVKTGAEHLSFGNGLPEAFQQRFFARADKYKARGQQQDRKLRHDEP